MPDQLIHLNTGGAVRRSVLLLPLALALAGGWVAVRWYIGDTIAEYMNPEGRGLETAQSAVRLAPNDPLAHWQLAEVEHNTLAPDQIGRAIGEYEQAVRLSPNDYRFWLSLGRALEQSGDTQKAERAMRRAVELAPSYSFPRWYLGNLLLRSGQNAEAFTELRRASEADPQMQPQVFNLAWQVYSQDFAGLKSAIGLVPKTRAAFAKYLIERAQIDDALRMWNDLSVKERLENRAIGESVIGSLLAAKRYRQTVDVWNDLAPSDAVRARVGQVVDGSFEQSSRASSAGSFVWQITSIQQAQVTIDSTTHHGGVRSLRMLFQARSKAVPFNLSQLIVVEPGAQYDLEYFLKTDSLLSAGTPVVEVVDATDQSILVTSEPAPSGNNDWQPVALTFKTGPKTEAILIRVNRASCGDNAECPIFGTLWYDDFNLRRRG